MPKLLSSVFLTFTDKEQRAIYEREKMISYAKLLPAVFLSLLFITFSLASQKAMGTSEHGDATNLVNVIVTFIVLFLAVAVRYRHFWTWFVNPVLTIYTLYYLGLAGVNVPSVSNAFKPIIGVCASMALVAMFNEVWLISTACFAPMLCLLVFRAGEGMVGSEDGNEVIVRCIFCIVSYGIVSYKIEQLGKQAFLGRSSRDRAFY